MAFLFGKKGSARPGDLVKSTVDALAVLDKSQGSKSGDKVCFSLEKF
jgi:hypothetical protein